MMDKLKNMSFKRKLFISFILVIIVMAIPIGSVTYLKAYENLKNGTNESAKKEMIQVDNVISSIFNNIKENNKYLASDDSIKK